MKRFLLVLGIVCAIVLGAVATASAETIAKDTVVYNGAWKMVVQTRANDYGEINVRYVCYLLDVTNSKGEPRKVPTDKATYESDKVTHIIYNVQDSGAKRIAKAVNVEAVRKAKADRAAAKAAKELATADE